MASTYLLRTRIALHWITSSKSGGAGSPSAMTGIHILIRNYYPKFVVSRLTCRTFTIVWFPQHDLKMSPKHVLQKISRCWRWSHHFRISLLFCKYIVESRFHGCFSWLTIMKQRKALLHSSTLCEWYQCHPLYQSLSLMKQSRQDFWLWQMFAYWISFHVGISLRQITCNEEVIVKYYSTSLPNPVMVFGRDSCYLSKATIFIGASG